MKLSKVFLIILSINVFFSVQSSQENILNNLFNQLEKVNNLKSASLLEEKTLHMNKNIKQFFINFIIKNII